MTRALICGVSGQDGAYLAELLLSKGYEVWGTSRDAQVTSFKNIEGALDIAAGARGPLRLGNLEVSPDWGWSPEYVKAAATQRLPRSAWAGLPAARCPTSSSRWCGFCTHGARPRTGRRLPRPTAALWGRDDDGRRRADPRGVAPVPAL